MVRNAIPRRRSSPGRRRRLSPEEKQARAAKHAERTKNIEANLDRIERAAYRIRYDIEIPGGLLRGEGVEHRSGYITALDEAGLVRGILLKLADMYGYRTEGRAFTGLIGEALNALPEHLRGNIAIALINGTGLLVETDEVSVCKDCGVEETRTLSPDQPEDADEDADPVMLDTTPHAETCHVHRITDLEGRPLNPVEYEKQDAIVILQPPRYAPLRSESPADDLAPDNPDAYEVQEGYGDEPASGDRDDVTPAEAIEEMLAEEPAADAGE